jgi:hypothetical protein
MTSKERILQILSGPEAARIRFSFTAGTTSVTIARHVFERVARAIRHGHIGVSVSTTFAAGVGALYHPDTDTIETPPVYGRANEGLVLHECTHAYFDITSNAAVNALQDEAAAYVVDALYFRMTNLQRPRWNGGPHPVAGTVADLILAEYQLGAVPIPAVDPTAWNNLLNSVKTNPVYVSGPAGTGGSYLHNGYRI